MKLNRIASDASLQDVQDQAEAVRALAAQFEDAALKKDLLRQANLAEAAALEREAAQEAERSKQQAALIRAAEAETLAGRDAISKPVVVDVKPGAELKQTIDDLTKVRHLLDYIRDNPVQVNTGGAAAAAASAASAAEALRLEALKHGRR
jgi:hypothetical protein